MKSRERFFLLIGFVIFASTILLIYFPIHQLDPGLPDAGEAHIFSNFEFFNDSTQLNEDYPSDYQTLCSLLDIAPPVYNLRDVAVRANELQRVRNEDKYGQLPSPQKPTLTSVPSFVFVIQLHKRIHNLRILIESLAHVKDINQSLLVFSTDYIDKHIIALINSIQFARTVQIFYPHSIQMFPDQFPGPEPVVDVSQTMERDNTIESRKDKYGHRRNASLSQVKHHWLWKMQFVFNHLASMKHYKSNVIFLEEDHYVVEDILHVQRLVEQHWSPISIHGLIALGSYAAFNPSLSNSVCEVDWQSSKHNLGLGISRAMWNMLSSCLEIFCTYDDYNWDWSLQHMGRTCTQNKFRALEFSRGTRVYHLGQCGGLHHNVKNCSVYDHASRLVQSLNGAILASLYPEKLVFVPFNNKPFPKFPANGGWGDDRDKALCKSLAFSKWDQSLQSRFPQLVTIRPVIH